MASRMAKNHGIAQRANVTLEVVQEAGTSYVFFWKAIGLYRKPGNQKKRGAVVLVLKDSWIYQRYKFDIFGSSKRIRNQIGKSHPIDFQVVHVSLAFILYLQNWPTKVGLQKWPLFLEAWPGVPDGAVWRAEGCVIFVECMSNRSVSVVSRSEDESHGNTLGHCNRLLHGWTRKRHLDDKIHEGMKEYQALSILWTFLKCGMDSVWPFAPCRFALHRHALGKQTEVFWYNKPNGWKEHVLPDLLWEKVCILYLRPSSLQIFL